MPEFIAADQLKKYFNVFGHFYTIYLGSGEKTECRSDLEIVSTEKTIGKRGDLLNQEPDAVFIMMNPGSSTPLESVDNNVLERNINKLSISLVSAKPDTTQYQVMRIMRYFNWGHVRVLNISDMRDSRSGSFTQRYNDLEKRTGFIDHSLFSDRRENELTAKLIRKESAPIICAWGVSTDLDPLIDRCLTGLGHETVISGLLKPNTSNKYYHPLPTLQEERKKWVNNMVIHLNER